MKSKNIYFDQASTPTKNKYCISKYSQAYGNLFDFKDEYFYILLKKLSAHFFVKEENISFVENATFGINWVAKKLIKENKLKIVYLSESEHLSNVLPWIKLAKEEKKIKIYFFKLKEIEDFKFKSNSIVSFANFTNLDGATISIEKIKHKNLNKNIIFVVDGTQFVQHKQINISKTNIDFFIFSAHKFFGPYGLGCIYSKNKLINFGLNKNNFSVLKNTNLIDLRALYYWYCSIDNILKNFLNNKNEKKENQLLNFFQNNFPKNKYFEWLNKDTKTLIFLLKTKKISSHDFVFFLLKNNICVRPGNCCSWNKKYLKISNNIVRISLNFNNTTSELKKFFQLIKKVNLSDFF